MHTRKLAELGEREAVADDRIRSVRHHKQAQITDWVTSLRTPVSSMMRPELWRQQLGEAVHTAPLFTDGQVTIATRSGRVHAFDAASGQPAWTRPLELATTPGDGMAMAAGLLWIPGHDGILYGIVPKNGALKWRSDIGGKLSSAPLVLDNTLIVSVDVDARDLREGAGQLVAVDAATGRVQHRWPVSQWGIRARSVRAGNHAFVGDRRGQFFLLDLRTGKVDLLFADGGRILGPAMVDESRRQVVIGDLYGRVRALDFGGRERWTTRLGGPVVGQPLIHHDHIFVGAGDGNVYQLDAKTGGAVGEPYGTRGPIATSPLAWGDWVFVGSNDQFLHAVDISDGSAFWTYHSGAPIAVTPALTEDGNLFVVDNEGNLNALRWCLTQYPKAARRMAKTNRWWEATTLWIQAGVADAALETAELAGRLDIVAELAAELGWCDKAAKTYETLANRRRDKPLKAAVWWAAAAEQWRLQGDDERALHCRLQDANARSAPLLTLAQGNLPQLTEGAAALVQVLLRNHSSHPARDLVLSHRGHVQRAGDRRLGRLGPNGQQLVEIPIIPTASGSAEIELTLQYQDSACTPQLPATLSISLSVSRPPEVHQHFYGPTVTGDGVIIMRGEGGRQIRVQSGEDAVEIKRSSVRNCPNCGEELVLPFDFCKHCGWRV